MTEDEAFIRAIVDSPGDDTPRLVYADWLEDRDDPRGAYLRAEREAVVTGDIARLQELAVGLDPVWVARVSMPPVGVCIEHTALTGHGPLLSDGDISEAERRIGVSFPADYRAFLLNYNGGYIDASLYFDTPDGPRTPQECGWWFAPIEGVRQFVLRPHEVFPDEPAEHWGLPPLTESVESWVSRFIVIGHNPDVIGGIFLGVRGADRGHVRILDTSVELEGGVRHNTRQPPYAPSLAGLLHQLRDTVWHLFLRAPGVDGTDDDYIPF
jgi:uncharacterized protein (TIGR02996 family)